MNPGRSVELYDLLLLKVALIRPNLNDTTVLNDTLKKSEKLDFAFDKVFQPDSSQSQVFEEISQLVQVSLLTPLFKDSLPYCRYL